MANAARTALKKKSNFSVKSKTKRRDPFKWRKSYPGQWS